MFRSATWLSRATALSAAVLGLGLWAAASGQVPTEKIAKPGPAPATTATKAAPDPAPTPAPTLFNPARADDENAIRALDEKFVQAYNAADLDALVATFVADAQLVDERGWAVNGRPAIRERFATALTNSPGAVLETELKSLRFLGPDTAVGRGVATLKAVEEGGVDEHAPFTVVFVKRGAEWLQGSVEDHSPPPAPDPESHAERLKDLTWMLGEWVNESTDAVVETNTRWDEGKSFLLQDYTLRREGKPVLKGTMRIGWDPVRKQIRSWVFDADGGFGEGFWSRDPDGRWFVRAVGSRRNGDTVETTRVITLLDSHRIRWESGDRSLNGQALPDGDVFIMVRRPPTPLPAAGVPADATKTTTPRTR